MKIVFMGTPEFAVPSLQKIITSNHQLVGVVTVPDKPAGRGQKTRPSAVKEAALAAGLPVLQPDNLKSADFLAELQAWQADLFIVVAFRILPASVFTMPPQGTINLHASLLPQYRGAAPINWALINGETQSGVSTFFIEKAVDTGMVLLQQQVPITADMNAGELHDLLAFTGAEMLLATIKGLADHTLKATPQTGASSLAPKITRELCVIDWNKSAVDIHNLVRGLAPVPAAFTFLCGQLLKIIQTRIVATDKCDPANIGKIIFITRSGEVQVQTGRGVIAIRQLKPEGKRIMQIEEFVRGHQVNVYEQFGSSLPV
ncbi:MAG TPA: methionyl-tRNA formyltransferase [bacterium]|nr:methionyl-tRNA formyltransferase [bacterium]HPN43122.1 methionyl-tRNA formyltransferase [bacterium]